MSLEVIALGLRADVLFLQGAVTSGDAGDLVGDVDINVDGGDDGMEG